MPALIPSSNLAFSRKGPLVSLPEAEDTKDPCPVFDGKTWHIFGSGGSSSTETWAILHATAPTIEGPWEIEEHATLYGVSGPHAVAPGVLYDAGKFHMFLQTDYSALGSKIEYLVSDDGHSFYHVNTALEPLPGTNEAGIYDPHPAIIDGKKYFVYSGFPRVGHGDIYLAKSSGSSWGGPWNRLGAILTHEDVPYHNQHENPDYEWGLEGAQLAQLPSGVIVLTAVCFLPEGKRGSRQRVFLALASNILGPYKHVGPVLNPGSEDWESGENGHATTLIDKDNMRIFYQGRAMNGHWKYGLAEAKTEEIEALASKILTGS